MAYVGTPIDTTNTFQSLTGDRFDGDASETAFTLSTAPSSAFDIEVFVGNVRQDPNSAYTLSGTTLTFTGAPPSGTNNIYVVHQAKSVGTIDVPSGGVQSGSLASAFLTGQTDIGAGIADADLFLLDDGAGGTLRKTAASRIKTYAGFNVSDITGATALAVSPASTDELLISDGGTLKRIDFAHINNNPSFLVKLANDLSISNNTVTKITWDSEIRDFSSAFASNKFTVPANEAGLYHFECGIELSGLDDGEFMDLFWYKNNSNVQFGTAKIFQPASDSVTRRVFGVTLDLAAADYIETFINHNEGGTPALEADLCYFSGFKITPLA